MQGTYSTDKTIWIEPVTGSIVNQSYHQVRETDEGDNFITLDLAFTPEEVQESIDDAKASRDQINLVRNTIPLDRPHRRHPRPGGRPDPHRPWQWRRQAQGGLERDGRRLCQGDSQGLIPRRSVPLDGCGEDRGPEWQVGPGQQPAVDVTEAEQHPLAHGGEPGHRHHVLDLRVGSP